MRQVSSKGKEGENTHTHTHNVDTTKMTWKCQANQGLKKMNSDAHTATYALREVGVSALTVIGEWYLLRKYQNVYIILM